ncbi:MAG: hypothetical protein KDA78_16200 [Planctomycetaceae bacterium]|nr:hypothetical protein [Planctomycetaceae bacterium]
MSFRKRKQSQSESVDLDVLIAVFGQASNYWETQPNILPLVRARFADACRDVSVRPVTGEEFRTAWKQLDPSDQYRIALSVSALEVDIVLGRVPEFSPEGSAATLLIRLVEFSQRLPLLKLDVLQQSDIRLEEFTRHFCADWELPIQGEESAQSEARLREIDFGRLMREAESARDSAEERMAYLRKLQEDEEQTRRPRRGKW